MIFFVRRDSTVAALPYFILSSKPLDCSYNFFRSYLSSSFRTSVLLVCCFSKAVRTKDETIKVPHKCFLANA